jgi:hypothetical protein
LHEKKVFNSLQKLLKKLNKKINTLLKDLHSSKTQEKRSKNIKKIWIMTNYLFLHLWILRTVNILILKFWDNVIYARKSFHLQLLWSTKIIALTKTSLCLGQAIIFISTMIILKKQKFLQIKILTAIREQKCLAQIQMEINIKILC